MKRIICLYGAPGSGKSTTCAGLFYRAKCDGYNVEMNREYVKDWVFEERKIEQGDQTYVFAKQARKERLYMQRELDLIITDSPLLLCHFYGMKYDEFEQKYNTSLQMLKNHHGYCQDKGYKVDHFFIKRNKPYNPVGRLQDEKEAAEIDLEIRAMLDSMGIQYKLIDKESPDDVVQSIYSEVLMRAMAKENQESGQYD